MIDPVIFTIKIGSLNLSVAWYGVLIVVGIIVGAWLTEREVRRRGGNPETVWDALLWILPAAIVGSRAWYVVNDILGGRTYYLENPIKIINTREGGLHIYGAVLAGALVAYLYARKNKVDLVMLLDSVAPALLIGQALARPANYINQELYGPPTTLPWGIPIDAVHRLGVWRNTIEFPVATTRFHPTFAYEIVWNLLAAALLLWVARRFADRIKPGAIFAGWLALEGLGRFLLEWFRPDQPRIPGTDISYSRVVAGLMAVAGAVWLARNRRAQAPE